MMSVMMNPHGGGVGHAGLILGIAVASSGLPLHVGLHANALLLSPEMGGEKQKITTYVES